MAGSDRLRRSDREIGVPFGVMKLTIAISRKAAPSTVTNNTLGSVSSSRCNHDSQTTNLSGILNSWKVAMPYWKVEIAHTLSSLIPN